MQLNAVGQFLNERAEEECPGESWQGLADAGTLISNGLAQLGLPQSMHDSHLGADE